MKLALRINTPEKMEQLGMNIAHEVVPNDCIAMNGELGAGKTTLTKGIGKVLEIKEVINSPTFTIMKIYKGTLNLYHLDVYRVENVSDDFELEEYFYLNGLTVIEWADRIKPLLPENTIYLDFKIETNGDRIVTINAKNEFIKKLEENYNEEIIR